MYICIYVYIYLYILCTYLYTYDHLDFLGGQAKTVSVDGHVLQSPDGSTQGAVEGVINLLKENRVIQVFVGLHT